MLPSESATALLMISELTESATPPMTTGSAAFPSVTRGLENSLMATYEPGTRSVLTSESTTGFFVTSESPIFPSMTIQSGTISVDGN